jgi:hypothetical protein
VGLEVQSRGLVAALGVVLMSGCATKPPPSTINVTPSPVAAALPRPTLTPAMPGPWRITKTEWSQADEEGFGEFLREIAESGCKTTISCVQSAANVYHDTDPPAFLFHADCAKWAYMLRAYYASKNGLPFSYVDRISGDAGADLRYGATSNLALERHDLVDNGTGINTVAELQALHDRVWTATYRMDPTVQTPVPQDFYSPKIQPGSIRAGTTIYDISGHVMIVYDITSDGSILYLDAHPDETVSRGVYGRHVPRSPASLGGGFKNFRPLKLVGATLRADGSYVGGHIVLAANEEIADFSLEQYRGNTQANDPNPQFRYNNASLDLYEYTRAAMSNGGFAYNPVYEIEVTMGSLCRDARDGTREADARVRNGFSALYFDLSKISDLWRQNDRRIVYHGSSLKGALAETYAAQEQACVAVDTREGRQKAESPLALFVRRSPDIDVQRLISQLDDYPPFVGMQPVGF